MVFALKDHAREYPTYQQCRRDWLHQLWSYSGWPRPGLMKRHCTALEARRPAGKRWTGILLGSAEPRLAGVYSIRTKYIVRIHPRFTPMVPTPVALSSLFSNSQVSEKLTCAW